MEELNTTKIFEEQSEARLELSTLGIVYGVLRIFSMSLGIHPGSKEVLKLASLTEEAAKSRIATIQQEMEKTGEIVAKVMSLLTANPVTIKIN